MTEITAPMSGLICKVYVEVGSTVNENDELLLLEAMKMQMPVISTSTGVVKDVNVGEGETVKGGSVMISIE